MLHLAGFYDNILGGHLRLWQLMQQGAAPEQQWIVCSAFSDRIEKAEQTIHHSKEHPSRLVLSVIE